MAKQAATQRPTKSGESRAERQKALLKANMAKRKAQARARAAQDTTENADTPPATRGK